MRGQPRFKVATIDGDLLPVEGRSRKRPGLSAHVLDTAYCHNVVATFRAEDRFWTGLTRGRDGAIEAAKRRAAELNAAE